VLSLYLNVFVLIVQAFLKIPLLKAWAQTQLSPRSCLRRDRLFFFFRFDDPGHREISAGSAWCALMRAIGRK
jgi:hypothetical protein